MGVVEIITKYHLYEVIPFGGRAKIIWELEERNIYTPLDLAELSKEEAKTLESALDSKGNGMLLWQTALCWNENNPTKRGCSGLKFIRTYTNWPIR